MNQSLLASIASLTLLAAPAFAKGVPLEQATITRTINDVRVLDPKTGSAPAKVSQIIKDEMGVKTGIKSRAELLFQDNTLTRLGAESYFSFRPGTRDMSLDSGTLLLQVPKDHGGATIRSASITASITGTTILMENIPGKSLKFMVLEGSMRIAMNNRIGEALSLKAGKMIIIAPGARNLPDPVNVDVRSVIKTSSLINPDLFSSSAKGKPAMLPSLPLIAEVISEQDKQRAAGKLQDTNLVILGKGTKVIAAKKKTMEAIVGANFPASWTGTGDGNSGSGVSLADVSSLNGSGSSSGSSSSSGSLSSTTSSSTLQSAASAIVVNAATTVVNNQAAIAAAASGGPGGTYTDIKNGAIKVQNTIQVSSDAPAAMSTTGGTIHLETLQTGGSTGIEVTDTAQLLSLLNASAPGPGGKIEFISAGSKILISGTTKADRGTITVTQNGAGGQIELKNANMAADVIRVSAVQSNGVLQIGGSHLTANNLLSLYGGSGTGGVHFTDNTLLDGNGFKLIAGKEVQISSGKVVTLGGGFTTVYTDKASYAAASGGNGSTSGRFEWVGAPGTAIPVFKLPYAWKP